MGMLNVEIKGDIEILTLEREVFGIEVLPLAMYMAHPKYAALWPPPKGAVAVLMFTGSRSTTSPVFVLNDSALRIGGLAAVFRNAPQVASSREGA